MGRSLFSLFQPSFGCGYSLLLLLDLFDEFRVRFVGQAFGSGELLALCLNVLQVLLAHGSDLVRRGPCRFVFDSVDVGLFNALLTGQVDVKPLEFQERSLAIPELLLLVGELVAKFLNIRTATGQEQQCSAEPGA